MKNCILIRHAKSEQIFGINDKLRKITTNGFTDISLTSELCKNYLPDGFSIWSSSAVRTTQTAKIFAKVTQFDFEKIIFKDELYTFDYAQLEKKIKSCDDQVKNLIIFGHNSAITDFVNKFGDIFIDNVPTSGIVILEFQTSKWSEISVAKTIKTIFPKDLK